jgi:hypothetical protein
MNDYRKPCTAIKGCGKKTHAMNISCPFCDSQARCAHPDYAISKPPTGIFDGVSPTDLGAGSAADFRRACTVITYHAMAASAIFEVVDGGIDEAKRIVEETAPKTSFKLGNGFAFNVSEFEGVEKTREEWYNGAEWRSIDYGMSPYAQHWLGARLGLDDEQRRSFGQRYG